MSGLEQSPSGHYSYLVEKAYVYVSNDTVSLYYNGGLYPQLIFSADSGDSWVIGTPSMCYDTITGEYINTNYFVVVEAKYDTVINNQTLRAMRLRLQNNCEKNFRSELVIEKAGGITSSIFPRDWGVSSYIFYSNYDWFKYSGSCYQDNTTGFMQLSGYTNAAGCNLELGINDSENTIFNIYPNPTENTLSLSGLKNDSYSYSLYNSSGQQVQSDKLNANTIDIGDKPNGLYLLNIFSPTYSKSFKVVKN